MNRTIAAAAAVLLLLAGSLLAPAAAETSLWLHVKVEEGDDTRVSVNLPMSVVGKALPMLPEKHFDAGRLRLEEAELSISEMRELWQAVQSSPDATFVTVDEGDDKVRVWKEGGYLMVSVVDGGGGEQVEVRLPGRVVDALLSGEGEELDLVAAMEALVDAGEGQLVEVTGDRERVRVWVDRVAEAD